MTSDPVDQPRPARQLGAASLVRGWLARQLGRPAGNPPAGEPAAFYRVVQTLGALPPTRLNDVNIAFVNDGVFVTLSMHNCAWNNVEAVITALDIEFPFVTAMAGSGKRVVVVFTDGEQYRHGICIKWFTEAENVRVAFDSDFANRLLESI